MARDFDELLVRVDEVLDRINRAGLTLKLEKCDFFAEKVKFLGHIIGRDGRRPNPEKVAALTSYKAPKNVKELQRFLGGMGYWRAYVQGFSEIASPLTDLIKKDITFYWGQIQDEAFNELKRRVCENVMLYHFDNKFPIELHTDAASKVGIGACLIQIRDGKEQPVEFASRKLSQAEKNYSISEVEALAVVWAVSKFRT